MEDSKVKQLNKKENNLGESAGPSVVQCQKGYISPGSLTVESNSGSMTQRMFSESLQNMKTLAGSPASKKESHLQALAQE